MNIEGENPSAYPANEYLTRANPQAARYEHADTPLYPAKTVAVVAAETSPHDAPDPRLARTGVLHLPPHPHRNACAWKKSHAEEEGVEFCFREPHPIIGDDTGRVRC